jgi:GNAT superfamily N-acetyltransferase
MFKIGIAKPSEIEQLVELLAVLFEQEADFFPDPQKQRRALTLLLDSPHAGVILASRAEGRVVGMVSLLFTISTAEGGWACWLEDLVVRPEWRDLGVGSELLAAAIAEASRRHLLRITLLTDRNNARARQFYTSRGFVESQMSPLRLSLPVERAGLRGPIISST